MTKVNLYDAVETCLQALDQGVDVESCLALFPALVDDLRPILTAAVQARSISVLEVPEEAVRRGRARLLQAAAQMREEKLSTPVVASGAFRLLTTKLFSSKSGFFGARFYRLALTTALMLAFLLTGGTGLVNASSSSLPGDHLYPVKRSWEGVRLFFVFNPEVRNELEKEFDLERVQEIEELYSEKRIARVDFQGAVQTRDGKIWVIGGLNIKVDDHTNGSAQIQPGSIVQVIGETDDGMIEAQQIILIATPGAMPGFVPGSTPTVPGNPMVLPTPRTIMPSDGIDSGEDSGDSPDDKPIIKPTEKPDDEPDKEPTKSPDDDSKKKPTEKPDDHEQKPTEKPGDDDHDKNPTEKPDD
jgi:hypothetical protein